MYDFIVHCDSKYTFEENYNIIQPKLCYRQTDNFISDLYRNDIICENLANCTQKS